MKKSISKGKTIGILLGVTGVVVVAALVTVFFLHRQQQARAAWEAQALQELETDRFYDGIQVEGIALGGKTMKQAKKLVAKVEADTRPNIRIRVKADGEVYLLKTKDFAFSYDTQKVLQTAFDYGRSGSLDARYRQVEALKTSGKAFEITATLKPKSIQKAAQKIAKQVDVEPVEPRISDFSGDDVFVIADGKNGRELDQSDLTEKLTRLLEDGWRGTVKAVVRTVKFKDTAAGIKRRATVMGTFSTTSVNNAAANSNMRRALEAANGIRLEPGEVFSFNQTTGDTTNGSNGYKKAGAINNGKLIEEYGGGICQASTTLYGAALRADLEIVERHNHTWPSVYVPIGQDASVNYPSSDFKFRNNKSYPIFISAGMSGTKLTVEIIGDGETDYDSISVVSEKTETISRGKTIEQSDSTLSKGKREVEREGRDGSRARAWKVYYKNGKELKRTEIASSYYPPITEIVRVGTKS